MGSGKSTVARRLAKRLSTDVADTDVIVETQSGRTVREIFDADGEVAFREAESKALETALASGAGVVAAAGGVVLSAANREALRRESKAGRAFVVWLRAEQSTLLRRTGSGVHRPLLDDGADEALSRMAAERSPLYAEVSDASVDTDGRAVDDVVGLVLAAVKLAKETE